MSAVFFGLTLQYQREYLIWACKGKLVVLQPT